MKIRNSFVSNSSSSSFVAVGFDNASEEFHKILKELQLNDYDMYGNDDFEQIDHGIFTSNKLKGICIYMYDEPFFIGIQAGELIEQDMRLSEIKKILKKTLAQYGIDSDKDSMQYIYGECGNG
jgi:hypothetical protein